MEHFYNKPHMGENWFTFPSLYRAMVQRFPSGSHFVEIGSWKGMSAAFMGVELINSGKDIKFDCIDIWAEEAYVKENTIIDGKVVHQDLFGEQLYNTFLNNIAPVRHVINPIRKDSVAAAADYADGSLDFVFVDGDHSYEGVKRDIIAWLPKMKPNSVFAGHDYAWTPVIQQAVAEIFGPGEFHDPWRNGCFLFEIRDGKPYHPSMQKNNQVFVYNT